MKTQNNDNRFLKLLILASVVLSIGLPSQILAKKPIKPGEQPGGDSPVCVTVNGDSVGIRGDGMGDYCDNKTTKVEAVISSAGALSLNTNTYYHKDPIGICKLFVNLGRELTLYDGTPFEDTELMDPNIVAYKVKLMCRLNDWPNSDLRDMPEGVPLTDNGHIRITISLLYSSGATGRLVISYEPDFSDQGCNMSGNGLVDITRTGATTWTIAVDEFDEAALYEVYNEGKGPSTAVVTCHTDPDGHNEDPFVLPPFKLTVELQ